MSLPRLLWLHHGDDTLPSQRLRVRMMMPFLAGAFAQTDVKSPASLWQVWQLRQMLRDADIVFLQKALLPLPVLKLLRHFSKRLVYDFDDAVHVRLRRDGHCQPSRKRSARFAATCRAADLIIAGNNVLVAAAQSAGGKNIVTLPTGVALALPQAAGAPLHDGAVVRLGWIGSNANLPYIEAMEPVFLTLQKEGLPFTLRVMAGRAPAFRQFHAMDFVPWASGSEDDFLSSIDIGLMPLIDNEHTRGKCAYKALQYMSHAKPVVVSDVGINAEWTSQAGVAVRTDEETIAALRRMIASSQLRTQMGSAGKSRVEREFAYPLIAEKLRSYLLQLLGNQKA